MRDSNGRCVGNIGWTRGFAMQLLAAIIGMSTAEAMFAFQEIFRFSSRKVFKAITLYAKVVFSLIDEVCVFMFIFRGIQRRIYYWSQDLIIGNNILLWKAKQAPGHKERNVVLKFLYICKWGKELIEIM